MSHLGKKYCNLYIIMILCLYIIDNDLHNYCLATINEDISYCYKINDKDIKQYCLDYFKE